MELEWNLDDLFINNNEFYKEIDYVRNILNSFINELDSLTLLELLDKEWYIKEKTNNILIYGSLRYYKNIKSEECVKLKEDAENFSNEVNTTLKRVDNIIINYGKNKINELIKEDARLEKYKHYLDDLFRLREHIQDDNVNKEIKDNMNLINKNISLYNDLLKNCNYGNIIIDGNVIELDSSNISKYLSSRDRETRKETYFAIYKSFKDNLDGFSKILNELIGLRIKNSSLEKFNSTLDKVLFIENIDTRILDFLINSVNSNLSLIQRYFKIKGDMLDIKDIHLYDLNVPLDNNLKTKYTLDEAIVIIKNALNPLGDKYLSVVESLLNGHIDATLDENKHQSITFSWNTYSFLNFRGSYNDLKNLIHELGHIVNYYLSKGSVPYLYEDSTIFVGETASIVNEILLNRYLYNSAESIDDKIFYLSKEIENYFTSVYKQIMYTEYEKKLYDIKLNRDLSSDLLSKEYFDLVKKYYGNYVNLDDEASYEWTRLGHIYRWSFYTYKYASGLLIASNIVNSLIDEKTISKEEYIKFLSLGSSMYSLDLLRTVNVDLTNSNVINSGFNILSKDIDELEKCIQKKRTASK